MDTNQDFDFDNVLIETALELVKKFDRLAEKNLPDKIVESVKFHSKGAAAAGIASGWVPGAGGLALAGVTAGFVWHMYADINKQLGIPFSENLVKSLAGGVATNLASYAVASIVVSTVFSLFPVIGTLGATAVVGATSYALTLASGYVYMKALILLANIDGLNVSEEQLKEATEKVIADTDMKNIIKQAKNSYKVKEES